MNMASAGTAFGILTNKRHVKKIKEQWRQSPEKEKSQKVKKQCSSLNGSGNQYT